MNNKKNIIEIKNLTKSFDDQLILDHIDLDIHDGEFITLLGPSGCGKSTFLRIIAGFDEADTGNILLNGKNITHLPPNLRHVNMIFQSYALFPHLSVFENIAFGLRCKKLPNNLIQEKVDEALQMIKLQPFKHRKPAQLSGGQKQRVAIARAIVNEPLVLLLDEPFSALDYGLRKKMQVELKALQRKLGITFVFVTHDQEEALSMSDRIAVMSEGRIEQLGTPRDIYERPKNLYVAEFIGIANVFETEVKNVSTNTIDVEIENISFTLNTKKLLKPGQKINIIIRPEDLLTWDYSETTEAERQKMIPAKVEQVIYKGSTVELVLRTFNGKKLSATQFFDEDDADLDFRVGESVWVEWQTDWELILPRE